MQPNRERIYLSPRDAARLCGVSVSTIYRWVEQGLIPVLKTLGNHNRFPIDSIEALVEKHQKNKRKGKQRNANRQ